MITEMTYKDEWEQTYKEENLIRVDWISYKMIDEQANEMNITLTESQKEEIARRINKAEYFPSYDDTRDIITDVISYIKE